ncbi:MAG: hypothetical protein ACTSRG_12960 [Candidatus Helarchaeota archaeon]
MKKIINKILNKKSSKDKIQSNMYLNKDLEKDFVDKLKRLKLKRNDVLSSLIEVFIEIEDKEFK